MDYYDIIDENKLAAIWNVNFNVYSTCQVRPKLNNIPLFYTWKVSQFVFCCRG